MKKILVIFIFLVFMVLIGISLKFGISIGNFRISSIEETIKSYSELENKIDKANDETRDYQELVSKINANEKLISTVKKEYTETLKEAKKNNSTKLKTYTKEYAWSKIEESAKKHGVNLKMSIEDYTDISKNLDITVTGPYLGIANFMYDIENNFKVSNFNMKKDEAKFQIRNIKILEEK